MISFSDRIEEPPNNLSDEEVSKYISSTQKAFNVYKSNMRRFDLQVFSLKTYFKHYKSELSKVLQNFDPKSYFYFEICKEEIVQMIKDSPDITDYETPNERDKEILSVDKISVMTEICIMYVIKSIENTDLDMISKKSTY